MKYWSFKKQIGLALALLLSTQILWAQEAEWKTKVIKDGAVTVKYRVFNELDPEGEKTQVIEFEAVTTTDASLKRCIEIMSDETNHVHIMQGTEKAWRVKDLANDEWITYYLYKPPWPMPASDVITRYKLEKDTDQRKAVLTGNPAPDMYMATDLPRMEHNYTRYTFTELAGGKVEIRMYSRSIPLIKAPNWLAKSWFPGGPSDMVLGIAAFAERKE